MNKRIRAVLTTLGMAALLILPLRALAADNNHPGYVDFDNIPVLQDAMATVDVRIGGWLMDIARQSADDDEDLQILAGIDTIRVRVFEMADDVDLFREEAENILDELNHTGWEEFARVRTEDELVFIMIKGSAKRLDGITIVAVDGHDEAVFVNIAGSIDPDDIARIINDKNLIHTNLDIDV